MGKRKNKKNISATAAPLEEKYDADQHKKNNEPMVIISLPEVENRQGIYTTTYEEYSQDPHPAIVIPQRIFKKFLVKKSTDITEAIPLQLLLNHHRNTFKKLVIKEMGQYGFGVFLKEGEIAPDGQSLLIYGGLYQAEADGINYNDHYQFSFSENPFYYISGRDHGRRYGIALNFQHTWTQESEFWSIENRDKKYTDTADTTSWRPDNPNVLCSFKEKKYLIPVNILVPHKIIKAEKPLLHMSWSYGREYWEAEDINPTLFNRHGIPIPTIQLIFNDHIKSQIISKPSFDQLISKRYLSASSTAGHDYFLIFSSKATNVLKALGLNLLSSEANKFSISFIGFSKKFFIFDEEKHIVRFKIDPKHRNASKLLLFARTYMKDIITHNPDLDKSSSKIEINISHIEKDQSHFFAFFSGLKILWEENCFADIGPDANSARLSSLTDQTSTTPPFVYLNRSIDNKDNCSRIRQMLEEKCFDDYDLDYVRREFLKMLISFSPDDVIYNKLLMVFEKISFNRDEWEAWVNYTQLRIKNGFVSASELADEDTIQKALSAMEKEKDFSTFKNTLIQLVPKIDGRNYPDLMAKTLHTLYQHGKKSQGEETSWKEKNELSKLALLVIQYRKQIFSGKVSKLNHSILFPSVNKAENSPTFSSTESKHEADTVLSTKPF